MQILLASHLALAVMVGCGSSTNGGFLGNGTTPSVSITASPASIAAGSASMLTVAAANASAVTVAGSDGSSYTMAGTGGSKSVTPGANTVYTATATGSAGASATATASITVTPAGTTPPPAAAPTVTLAASPASVIAGGSSTLSFASTGATSLTISGTDGSSWTAGTPASGTHVVSPSATTTYTATATGAGGSAQTSAVVTVSAAVPPAQPTVTLTANPTTIAQGSSSTLTVSAANATGVTLAGTDGTNLTLPAAGGSASVSPTANSTYTATATGAGGSMAQATASVTVVPAGTIQSVQHVIFELQENHTFDNYLGRLNPYRAQYGFQMGDDGVEYDVDGLDDARLATTYNEDDNGGQHYLFKLKSTCIDDASSDWLASYGDVNRYDFLADRPILGDGFVHNAEGYANSCNANGAMCSGSFTDTTGNRAMGYYDQDFLNYYYFMASEFAVSDRWFSPISSKSVDNRIATFSGGTTQGLVADPGNDGLPQLPIQTIFDELQSKSVSWKIYYTVTEDYCIAGDDDCAYSSDPYPATYYSKFTSSLNYLYENPADSDGKRAACTGSTVASSAVGDPGNSFCIDPTHLAPITSFYSDLTNGTLPSFAFIEAGYGNNDEHPGSGQSVLEGQMQVAKLMNAFMASSAWSNSVFFLAYDEGGGPYDHVPPVPTHSNDQTDPSPSTASYPDIGSISVNPDGYYPCLPQGGTPTLHCDLTASEPGANAGDAPAQSGFAAQLGFRVPNMVVSPFTRRHYVSHIPMDHTAVIRFVEDRFLGTGHYLTARDAAQPNLLDFFDFSNVPWAKPPAPPTPVSDTSSCTPNNIGP